MASSAFDFDNDGQTLILAVLSVLLAPFTFILIGTIILASFGKSLGIRRLYVNALLKVFEWGQKRITAHERKENHDSGDEATGKYEEDGAGVSRVSELQNGSAPERRHTMPHSSPTDVQALKARLKMRRGSQGIIQREIPVSSVTGMKIHHVRSLETMTREFQLSDATYFAKSGIEAIIDDEVTKRFSAEELPTWNLMSRTNNSYEFISWRLTSFWVLGGLFRYFFLLPFRISLACAGIGGLVVGTALVGCLPAGRLKRDLNRYVNLVCFRICARGISAVINIRNTENRATSGGICVANHTSPIDVVILATDNCYAMVGQKHGGLLNLLQTSLDRASRHVWFERSEANDRLAVARRLREHIEDKENLPILIFPEGTCINNTSVMMFKKGSFEIADTIYPVAIKYDPRFADAFWNSSKYSMVVHLLNIMTSWAIVCDVWYLPPEKKREGETAIQFANRVKRIIATQGGLVDLDWDGQLKRSMPKPTVKENSQLSYSKLIKSD